MTNTTRRRLRLPATLAALSYCVLNAKLVTATTATITNDPAYASLRPCAQDCYYYGVYKGPDNLASHIGCDNSNIENECLCRGDLQDDADAYLSSCVLSKCSRATVDVNSAISLYNGYCTSNGFIRDAMNTPAPTGGSTGGSGSDAATSTPTSGEAGGPAQTDTTGSGSSSGSNTVSSSTGGGGLATGEMIGIIVGVLGFIATAIGACLSYRQLKQKRAERAYNAGGDGGGLSGGQTQQHGSHQMWPQYQPPGGVNQHKAWR